MHIVLAVLLLFVAVPAWAEWVKLGESSNGTTYIDPTTLRKDGDIRRIFVLFDRKKRDEKGELSLRTLDEFDCKKKQSRPLHMSIFDGPMGSGKQLGASTAEGGHQPWRQISPGSAGQATLDFVCSR